MLIEIWERLHGYDKWVQVEATVESSRVKETAHSDRSGNVSYTYGSGDVLVWTDRQGARKTGSFTVPDDSPLYQLVGGESITIRYNPADPDEFYFRELLRTRVNSAIKRFIFIVTFFGIVVLGYSLRARYLLR